MDPRTSSQDVIRCDVCTTAVVQMHCDSCHVNLCKACVGEHISTDDPKNHQVVKFQLRNSTLLYPKCASHEKEICVMYCKKCEISVCPTCVNQHRNHKILNILDFLEKKRNMIEKEQSELKETIYPTYQGIFSELETIKIELEKEAEDLLTAITKHGEFWHSVIDKLVDRLKIDVRKLKDTKTDILQRKKDEINMIIVDIRNEIDLLDKAIDSNDISETLSVKLKDHYKKLPPKLIFCKSKFTRGEIQEGNILKLFGSLTALGFKMEKNGYRMKNTQESTEDECFRDIPIKPSEERSLSSFKQESLTAESSLVSQETEPLFPANQHLPAIESTPSTKERSSEVRHRPPVPRKPKVPRLVKLKPSESGSRTPVPLKSTDCGLGHTVNHESVESGHPYLDKKLHNEPAIFSTEIKSVKYMINIAFLGDEKIWVCKGEIIMELYSVNKGFSLESITTRSENIPTDIAVTKSGNLIYTDKGDGTVNIVKKGKTQELIRLQNWRPMGIYSTFDDDLLITMENDDHKQSKVVRYSGYLEKQTIQFDDDGNPLFIFGGFQNFICENRNRDICVADCGVRALVVVNQTGKFRFKYTGHSPAPKNKPFNPTGITTDSQGHILTADYDNYCVHIIDKDGRFLHFIKFEHIQPYRLCTDRDDNLFVAVTVLKSWPPDTVKKIRYLY
ncbi:uncharacterized protein LOC134281992 [Saccostrea cucullata]|uniref:uncharacterized protein LOC134281992 n=1 Tax=Saccostrea cuccullata TaxID=36930 RepID=UPI002ED321E3